MSKHREGGAIFSVCSHTFILFWLRKTSVSIETYQLSFHMFICASHPEISSFFDEFTLFIPIFVLEYNFTKDTNIGTAEGKYLSLISYK